MPRNINQKRKLLYLHDILQRETDEDHPLTLRQLTERLEEHGITAERKSLYDDFEQLRLYGDDILTTRDKTVRYYIGSRDFELPELQLLVDAVQSSRFITPQKSRELIGKLASLTSVYQASELQRKDLVSGRIKNMNESIYYNVDGLQAAIRNDLAVEFQYFDWDKHKKKRFRRNGTQYKVSPWTLIWDDENYYLIGYDHVMNEIRHYRVDRMMRISMTEEHRLGKDEFEKLDMARYTCKVFSMFGGHEERVDLHCTDRLADVIFDRFGRDVPLIADEDGFTVSVPVIVSNPFYGWLAGYGDEIRILSPAPVADNYCKFLKKALESYQKA